MARPLDLGGRAPALALVLGVLAGCIDQAERSSAPPSASPRGVPTGNASALVIGGGGGQVVSPDTHLTVTVPPGAVAADTDFTIVEITNTAPGGVGTAYRLGPAGLTLDVPVTLLFRVPAAVTPSVNDLAVATQPETGQATGFWVRVPGVARDGTARTLSVAVDHFSDWALVTSTTARDLNGPIRVTSTLEVPFTAQGWATLNHAGGDSSLTYYVAGGSLTLQEPVAHAGGTCTSPAPTWTLHPNIATFEPSPVSFEYGLSGSWNLTCFDGLGGPLPGDSTSFALDTVGISNYQCPRGYVGTPVLTPDQMVATFRVDCGGSGYVEATWDLVTCTPGAPCTTNPNACVAGTTSCTTGRPACVDTATPTAAGSSCGSNLVCDGAGACIACAASQPCQNPTSCFTGLTSCSTGSQACVDTTTPRAAGESCGTDLVCNGAGACGACAASQPCQNPTSCFTGLTSCSTGSQTCVDTTTPRAAGESCGTGLVCNGAGACNACVAGGVCTGNPNVCVEGVFSCASGSQQCVDGTTPTNEGGACGTGGICTGGTCT